MNQNERDARRREEDQALNRALCWAGGAIVLEFLLLLIKRFYIEFQATYVEACVAEFLHKSMSLIGVLGPILFVLGLIWACVRIKKERTSGWIIVASIVSLVLGVCGHVATNFKENGVQMLFLLVPVLAGMALIYYLYQREFFLAASVSGLSVLGMWFFRYREHMTAEIALVLLAMVVVMADTLLLKKHDGVLPKSKLRFVPAGTSYGFALVGEAVALASMLLSLFLGTVAAYYLIFFMIAWLFVLLVYYTVKMM